eukprot:c4492_g1_i1.p1 GENE.c4492_g1_i1~~c4492_g1_i1.p1  ORF type:complete len:1128 (-),score=201.97 c4492_g1_i1:28-3375(-)
MAEEMADVFPSEWETAHIQIALSHLDDFAVTLTDFQDECELGECRMTFQQWQNALSRASSLCPFADASHPLSLFPVDPMLRMSASLRDLDVSKCPVFVNDPLTQTFEYIRLSALPVGSLRSLRRLGSLESENLWTEPHALGGRARSASMVAKRRKREERGVWMMCVRGAIELTIISREVAETIDDGHIVALNTLLRQDRGWYNERQKHDPLGTKSISEPDSDRVHPLESEISVDGTIQDSVRDTLVVRPVLRIGRRIGPFPLQIAWLSPSTHSIFIEEGAMVFQRALRPVAPSATQDWACRLCVTLECEGVIKQMSLNRHTSTGSSHVSDGAPRRSSHFFESSSRARFNTTSGLDQMHRSNLEDWPEAKPRHRPTAGSEGSDARFSFGKRDEISSSSPAMNVVISGADLPAALPPSYPKLTSPTHAEEDEQHFSDAPIHATRRHTISMKIQRRSRPTSQSPQPQRREAGLALPNSPTRSNSSDITGRPKPQPTRTAHHLSHAVGDDSDSDESDALRYYCSSSSDEDDGGTRLHGISELGENGEGESPNDSPERAVVTLEHTIAEVSDIHMKHAQPHVQPAAKHESISDQDSHHGHHHHHHHHHHQHRSQDDSEQSVGGNSSALTLSFASSEPIPSPNPHDVARSVVTPDAPTDAPTNAVAEDDSTSEPELEPLASTDTPHIPADSAADGELIETLVALVVTAHDEEPAAPAAPTVDEDAVPSKPEHAHHVQFASPPLPPPLLPDDKWGLFVNTLPAEVVQHIISYTLDFTHSMHTLWHVDRRTREAVDVSVLWELAFETRWGRANEQNWPRAKESVGLGLCEQWRYQSDLPWRLRCLLADAHCRLVLLVGSSKHAMFLIQFWTALYTARSSPSEVLERVGLVLHDLCPDRGSRALGDAFGGVNFPPDLRVQFMKGFSVQGTTVPQALRVIFGKIRLPAEAQQIDRLLMSIATALSTQLTMGGGPTDVDQLYVFLYGIVLLSTDLHNPIVQKKMTLDQFALGFRELPRAFLQEVYDEVARAPVWPAHAQAQTMAKSLLHDSRSQLSHVIVPPNDQDEEDPAKPKKTKLWKKVLKGNRTGRIHSARRFPKELRERLDTATAHPRSFGLRWVMMRLVR